MAMKKLPKIIGISVLGLLTAASLTLVSSIVLHDGLAAHAYGTWPPGSSEGGKGGGGDTSTGGGGTGGTGGGDAGGHTGSGN